MIVFKKQSITKGKPITNLLFKIEINPNRKNDLSIYVTTEY
jgi:hypothetical protein